MKKRILALLLMAAMSFSLLAACGKDEPPVIDNKPGTSAPVEEEPSFSANLTLFYNEMMAAAEEPPMMMDLAAEAEMLDMTYPGLSAIQTKQLVACAPMISAVAMEFVFVEVTNSADADTVKQILQDRIDAQVNGGAWYPETIEQWQKHSEIVAIDNYVCLFVCSEKDVLIDAFRNGTDIPTWAKVPGDEDTDVEGGIMDMPVEDGPAAFDPDAKTSTEPEEVKPTITLTKTDVTTKYEGELFWIKAKLTGSDEAVTWSSSDENIATVDEDGMVVSVAPGTVYITASTESGLSARCIVRCKWEVEKSVDLYAFYETLAGTYGQNWAANMSLTDAPDFLEGFYPGLSAIETKQLHVYQPMMGAVVCEIALVEVADSADVDAVKAILQGRIDTQAGGGAWYPESVEGWLNNSRIAVNGNFVMMIAYYDAVNIVNAFNGLF